MHTTVITALHCMPVAAGHSMRTKDTSKRAVLSKQKHFRAWFRSIDWLVLFQLSQAEATVFILGGGISWGLFSILHINFCVCVFDLTGVHVCRLPSCACGHVHSANE